MVVFVFLCSLKVYRGIGRGECLQLATKIAVRSDHTLHEVHRPIRTQKVMHGRCTGLYRYLLAPSLEPLQTGRR